MAYDGLQGNREPKYSEFVFFHFIVHFVLKEVPNGSLYPLSAEGPINIKYSYLRSGFGSGPIPGFRGTLS